MFLEGGICMNIKVLPKSIDAETDNRGSSHGVTLVTFGSNVLEYLDQAIRYEEEELEDGRLHIIHDHRLYNFAGKGILVLKHFGGWREYFSHNMTISEANELIKLYEEFLEDNRKCFPGYCSLETKTNWEILLRTKYRDLKVSNIV